MSEDIGSTGSTAGGRGEAGQGPGAEPPPTMAAAPAAEAEVRRAAGRQGGGLTALLWIVVLLAAVGGGAYAAWPLWSGYVATLLPPALRDPFEDRRLVELVGRVKGLEDVAKAGEGTVAALRDLEAENARSTERVKALIERIDALERAIESIRKMIAATAAPAADAGSSVRDLGERLTRLEREAGEPRAGGPDAAEWEARNQRVAAALAELAQRIGKLERVEPAPAPIAAGAQAVVLAVGQLRDALRTAGPFAKEVQALRAVAAGNTAIDQAIAAIEPDAGSGIATLETLRARFEPAAAAAVRAAVATEGDGWARRARSFLASLVTVRRTGADAPGEGADAVVARAEAHLQAGDLVAAVEALDGLSGPPAEAVARWLEDARARIAAERAMTALHGHAISLLVPAKK